MPSENVKCSFCGKNQDEVRKIIAGPDVYICDECIDLCNDIIEGECEAEEARGELPPPTPSLATSALCIVCRVPKSMDEVVPLLDRGFICATCVEMTRAAAETSGKR